VKDAQKPDHISLGTLISHLKEGRFVIPDFQREFEWLPWDIRDLMRSIFLDYYIGSLLLWRGKGENFRALACEPIYGYEGDGNEAQHIVLDGQQRLTAMYYAFVAPNVPAPNRANRYLFFIQVQRFMEMAYDEAFHYDWTRGGSNLLADTQAQYQDHMFPLSVVGRGGWDLPNWVQGYEAYWRDKASAAQSASDPDLAETAARYANDAKSFGEHLKEITEQYQIAYVELDRELALDKVCDIFTQVNSKGIRLDVFDLINAFVKPKGLQLKHMWRLAQPQLDFVETERMNVYILQVMSILRQAYCSPKYLYYLLPQQEKVVRDGGSLRKEILIRSPEEFGALWNQAVEALSKAIGLLRHPQEFGAISSAYLPYVSILPVFSAMQVQATTLPPNRRLDAQRKIRHWYWASVFTNRYSGSVESTAARDYLDVTSWFEDDAREPAVLGDFRQRFRTLDLRREVRRGTSVYNGIFNLLVLRGARDWMTGNVPQYGDLDDHHIVPKDWRKSHPEVGTLIDTILNRTPLTADTNRHVIGNRLPNAYLPELIASNGEPTVRATLESHLISPAAFDILLRDPFTREDFEAFIGERQRTFQDAIEDLLVKARLDLPPRLRELDVEIEEVELALRHAIADGLNDDASKMPSHVQQRVSERVRAAARRNPALSTDHYSSLTGQLEYFDLRELQDTIASRALWPEFESRFGTKDGLNVRFGQLAELRNGIRHSRTVDEITRADGEAALLWFRQVLPK
jgi:hypothetical protein